MQQFQRGIDGVSQGRLQPLFVESLFLRNMHKSHQRFRIIVQQLLRHPENEKVCSFLQGFSQFHQSLLVPTPLSDKSLSVSDRKEYQLYALNKSPHLFLNLKDNHLNLLHRRTEADLQRLRQQ